MINTSPETPESNNKRPQSGVDILQEFLNPTPDKKEVKNSLHWKDKTTDVKTSSIEDRGELRQPLEKKHQQNFLTKSISGALAFLGFKSEEKIVDDLTVDQATKKSVEIFTDKTKLTALNNAAEKAKKTIEAQEEKMAKIEKFLGIPKLESTKEKTDIYRKEDFAEVDLLKKTWQDAAYKDREKSQKRGWLGRVFVFVPKLFIEFGFFRTVKNLEKKGVLGKIDKLESAASKAKQQIDTITTKAKNTLDQTKQIADTVRSNKALNMLKLQNAKEGVKNFKSSVRKNVNDLRAQKIKPEAMAKKIQGNLTDLFGKVKKGGYQKEFQHLIQNGKVPGIEKIKSAKNFVPKGGGVGSIGIASAFNIAIFDGIQSGSFGAFTDSLLSKETLKLAFVPGVGTYQSIQRWKNNDAGIGWKAGDLALNVLGDGILAWSMVGSIFTGGASLAAGYAARGGLIGLGKSMLTKSALKSAGKAVLKTGKKSLVLTGISAPITIAIGTLMGAIDKDKIEDAFINNVFTDEQKRSFALVKE
jgi:hypothetical protein